MTRYHELIELLVKLKPKHIVEIGTWNGKRAAEMMAVTGAYYTGFDLFEDANKETDERELNVKQHHSLVDVAERLEFTGTRRFKLIRGDTNKTLPEWIESSTFEPFDFAFIDGGHSVATIDSDFKHIFRAIEDGGTIVMDDYYRPELEGFGCNHLQKKYATELFTTWDKFTKGDVTMMVVPT